MKSRRQSRSSLSDTFCRCIKHVRKSVTLRKSLRKSPRNARTKESAAIGICVRSVLHSRGKTMKRFTCKKRPYLETQSRKHR